jgi:hypothetical protein
MLLNPEQMAQTMNSFSHKRKLLHDNCHFVSHFDAQMSFNNKQLATKLETR